MPSIEVKSKITFQNLLQGVEGLNASDLESFVEKVLNIRAKKNAQVLSKEETKYLKIINQGLNEDFYETLKLLKEKQASDELTKEEKTKADSMVKEFETLRNERLTALLELSKIRGVPFKKLGMALGIFPNDLEKP